jgi:HEAT repeats
MYLSYAAESGGEVAIPPLLARLHTPDANTREAMINALGNTGSRAAVPLLIGLLGAQAQDEDGRNTAISVNVALRQLTHVYAEQDAGGTSIASRHSRWQNRWLTSGPTATIYKPDECVPDTKLP